MSDDVAKFYDTFKQKQVKTGINLRHRTIFHELKKVGLKRNHSVLEIGCGIGTVTSLISKFLTKGKILGVDISPVNIEFARNFVNKPNTSFLVSDMTDFHRDEKYDFIVLPDVLEHIPVEQHFALFKTLANHSKVDTVVFINIPSPHFQNFISRTNPSVQQIIDQELPTDKFLQNVYPNGFLLHSLRTYSLGYHEGDYQQIILKRNFEYQSMKKFTKRELVIKEIVSRLWL